MMKQVVKFNSQENKMVRLYLYEHDWLGIIITFEKLACSGQDNN